MFKRRAFLLCFLFLPAVFALSACGDSDGSEDVREADSSNVMLDGAYGWDAIFGDENIFCG